MQNTVHLPFWVKCYNVLSEPKYLHAACTNQDCAISLLGDILPRSHCEH